MGIGHKFFGWTDCASSFLFSCTSQNSSSSQKPSTNDSVTLVDRGYRNQTQTYRDTAVTYKPAANLQIDDSIDVFFDLETGQGEARYVRQTIRHSSIFRKPSQLTTGSVLGSSSPTPQGRSLIASEQQNITKSITSLKAKMTQRSREDRKNKELLHAKLTSRMEWFRNKAELNNLLRKYAKEFGYDRIDAVKAKSYDWKRFKMFKNVSTILTQDGMGSEYVGNNEVIANKMKEVKDEVSFLLGADTARITASPDDEVVASTAAFNRALGSIMISGGGGMRGRALDETDDKVTSTIAKSILFSSTDTFQSPGWKLQHVDSSQFKPNVTLGLEKDVIFYGMGSCPNVNVTSNDPVTFYLTLFRTNCLPEAKQYLEHLIEEKYVQVVVQQNLTLFAFSNDSEGSFALLQEKKRLRSEEVRRLGAALELVAFSETYVNLAKKGEGKSWGGRNVSRSVSTIRQFFIRYVTLARSKGDEHFLKLVRNLVVTLKGVMTKLIQDEEMFLAQCVPTKDACRTELSLNSADQFEIHAISQFLIRGLAPVERNFGGDDGVEVAFRKFVDLNKAALRESVAFYQ
ncbi:uncharacterized protein LOC110849332 [Folsomia candida]|uniref:uncharacterized protein LOC110849332 n=1 Tax=Folsomia candida TaxID=158441 RepID=UPI0016052F88|nr:uncharacterized protein LOC110849332 [Folsomia candida]